MLLLLLFKAVLVLKQRHHIKDSLVSANKSFQDFCQPVPESLFINH